MRSRFFAALTAMALGMTLAGPAAAAMEVVVSVSPAEATLGQPVEVLLRTFVPFGQEDLGLPVPSLSYPAPSGYLSVLYPVADYPFDVVAQPEVGPSLNVRLTRDPGDATLWRGTFQPTEAGVWRVVVRNFPTGQPGTTAQVRVRSGPAVPAELAMALVALVLGLLLGVALGRRLRR
jgi:hypothetical protein